MSGNHETIIPVGNPVKKFPSGLQEFLKTASEEDRKLIGGYTESLCMICSAIREGLR